MTATEPTTEEALWAYIGEVPEDGHRRLWVADWFQDREGVVGCVRCRPAHPGLIYTGMDGMKWIECLTCHGTGVVSNGHAETAEGLRMTKDAVPIGYPPGWSWWRAKGHAVRTSDIDPKVYAALEPVRRMGRTDAMADYHTAADAIKDLVRAWCKVHKRVSL